MARTSPSTGTRVVGLIRWRLRGHSGVALEVVEAWVNWFLDGKIARIEQHAAEEDAAASVRAADLWWS